MSLHSKVHCCSGFNAGIQHICLQLPLPGDNEIFKETKRSVKYLEIAELLKSINNSCLCKGLGQDEDVLPVAVDPT